MAILSKILTPTDVGSSLSWPIDWLRFLPPFLNDANKVSFRALGPDGRVWTLTCSVRRRGPYPKPMIVGSSWLPFVQENDLDAHDKVTFYYDPDHPIKFRIRVNKLKSMRLMGHDIVGFAEEE